MSNHLKLNEGLQGWRSGFSGHQQQDIHRRSLDKTLLFGEICWPNYKNLRFFPESEMERGEMLTLDKCDVHNKQREGSFWVNLERIEWLHAHSDIIQQLNIHSWWMMTAWAIIFQQQVIYPQLRQWAVSYVLNNHVKRPSCFHGKDCNLFREGWNHWHAWSREQRTSKITDTTKTGLRTIIIKNSKLRLTLFQVHQGKKRVGWRDTPLMPRTYGTNQGALLWSGLSVAAQVSSASVCAQRLRLMTMPAWFREHEATTEARPWTPLRVLFFQNKSNEKYWLKSIHPVNT